MSYRYSRVVPPISVFTRRLQDFNNLLFPDSVIVDVRKASLRVDIEPYPGHLIPRFKDLAVYLLDVLYAAIVGVGG